MNAGCERVGRRPKWRALAAAAVTVAAVIAGPAPAHAALTGVDLSTYQRVARYDLPEPTRTTAPAGSLLAQEASGVTYDWDTNTLFVVGDGGTSVVQVSLTGQLIDSMTLAAGSSPQGTDFYDTEGIAYAGGGKFVFTEERYRQLVLFTYAPGTTLTRAQAQTVKVGSTIGNTGNEGVSWDPQTNGFIVVKETQPEGIFQTAIDWNAGTATNGSDTAEPANLFDPALAGLNDFSDVYALSNVTALDGTADSSHLLIISQESGKIENVGRDGHVYSALTIPKDADNPLSVADQTHEGVTMDKDGTLYDVSENGGGDEAHPQLWVYTPQAGGGTNQAPTGVTLTNQVSSLPASTSTAARVKVADVNVADDGLGTNALSVTGADAASFEVDPSGLYIKAGTALAKSSYTVAVAVDDSSVGTTPDATSAPLTVTITPAAAPASLAVTEVSPWSSGDSSYAADWWELTNTGTQPVDLTGYRMDDDSNSLGNAVALNGVSSLAPGQSAIFIEGGPAQVTAFESAWFGASVPAGFQMGYYSGSGVGLSTGGDQVNIFAPGTATHVTGVSFGAATSGRTFDNPTGASGAITTLSAAGKNGAFTVGGETGSPGATMASLAVTEVSPWSSGNSPYAADWWELTNMGAHPADITGFKMDDNSNAFGNAVALNGVTTLAPGESAIFIEGGPAQVTAFESAWFGASVPAGFQMGYYSGSGVGLSTDGDAVNIFDPLQRRITGVTFGASTSEFTFDNAAGASGAISALSVAGKNGARTVNGETGSPGAIKTNTTSTSTGGDVTATVPSQLVLSLGAPAAFGPLIIGTAKDYLATTTATVSSTAGDAALTVVDASTTAPGHLVNGAFALPQALQVNANGGAYQALSGTPATLLTYTGPITDDAVAVGLKQSLGADDALRSGGYSKTLTFTLSTTTP